MESIVCAETYVGAHISLNRMAAQGGLLMDFERGVGVEVMDEFVLSSMGSASMYPSLTERICAFFLGAPLTWIARLVNRGVPPEETICQISRSKTVCLLTYAKGPLCLRRAPWLQMVAEGKIKIFGVLPRTEEDWKKLSPEARSVLDQASVGVFALSDLYDCHSPKEADEWMHAVFQAGNPAGSTNARNWSKLFKIIFINPVES